MKRFLAIAIAAGVSLMLSGSAFAAGQVGDYIAGAAANGIARSRHNLGNLGNYITVAPGYKGAINDHGEGGGTSEICVFCHTPHHTASTLSDGTTDVSIAPAPLWNRSRSTFGTFTGYGSTIGGTPINSVGGVTLACLSCHDGVTAIDNLINAPGPGLSRASAIGSDQGRVNDGAGWLFQDATSCRTGETCYDGPDVVDGITAYQIGAEDRLNIGNGGLKLSNDHPMSVAYHDDRASLRPTSTVINDIDLSTGLYFSITGAGTGHALTGDTTNIYTEQGYVQELKNNLSQNRWAVKGYVSSTATIADLLRGADNKVECSSCHDPHFKNLSNVDLDTSAGGERDDPTYTTIKQDGLFLRRVGGNAGSGVCRTCHNK